jgi:hypothetical protein
MNKPGEGEIVVC